MRALSRYTASGRVSRNVVCLSRWLQLALAPLHVVIDDTALLLVDLLSLFPMRALSTIARSRAVGLGNQ
eukprot:418463-Pleurochrysis_carterae.AAC.3